MRDEVLWLVGSITGVLTLGSITAAVLKHRVAPHQTHAAIDNLATRIRSWWVMAALLGAVLWAGPWAISLMFAVLSAVALKEFVSTVPTPRVRDWVTGFTICVVCIAFIPALLTLDTANHAGRNIDPVVFLLLITQSSDVLQYIWGKLLGRHRIAPILSPSKTVEGFIGGVASATVIGASVWWITPFSPALAALAALLVALLGFAGGLYLSAQKRARGIKDWGDLIKGHGGVLDRMDSLWLPAPVYFTLLKLGVFVS